MSSKTNESTGQMPGTDILGHTFNAITGDYAIRDDLYALIAINGIQNPKSEQTKTNDADGQDYEVPQGISYVPDQASMVGSTAAGASKSSFTSDLSAKASIDARYGLYQGSVDAAYGSQITANSEEYYLTTFDTWSYYNLGLSLTDVDISTTDLESTDKDFCLSRDMQAAFDTLEVDGSGSNATEFFRAYGTHVVTGIIMGGQCRYWAYGAQSDFKDENEFNVNAEAKYDSLTGSAAFSAEVGGSSTTEESSVESQTSIEAYGGSAETQSELRSDPSDEDYQAWGNSVADNLAWIDYQGGGVSAVWELCNDAEKREYLESVFGQLYGSRSYSFETYDQIITQCRDGTKPWNSDPSHVQSWVSGNNNQVIVGFGGNINSNKHLNKMIIITYDVVTGEYLTNYTGGGDADTKWDAFYMAPEGSVITGIGMSQKSKDFSKLYVWYQKLALADQSGVYLDSEISSWPGSSGSPAKVNNKNLPAGTGWCADGATEDYRDLQRYYQPEASNQYAMSGIAANSSDNNNGFNYLVIYQDLLHLSNTVSVKSDIQ